MAKVTHLGLVPPDDPIYWQPPQSYVPWSKPSTKNSAKNTDGGQNSSVDPMQAAEDAYEAGAMELASGDQPASTESTTPGKKDKN